MFQILACCCITAWKVYNRWNNGESSELNQKILPDKKLESTQDWWKYSSHWMNYRALTWIDVLWIITQNKKNMEETWQLSTEMTLQNTRMTNRFNMDSATAKTQKNTYMYTPEENWSSLFFLFIFKHFFRRAFI